MSGYPAKSTLDREAQVKRGPAYLVVLLAALLPQLNALVCGFALDDFGLIVHNPAIRYSHVLPHVLRTDGDGR